MRIECQKELCEAIDAAIAMDRQRLRNLLAGDGRVSALEVEEALSASRSLLMCLESRLRTEAAEAEYKVRTVDASGKRLKLETCLYPDWSALSFFFREHWVKEDGTVADDEARTLAWEVTGQNGDVVLVYSAEEAEKARDTGLQVELRERGGARGMCGGIIFHNDWRDGKRSELGSWSTHT